MLSTPSEIVLNQLSFLSGDEPRRFIKLAQSLVTSDVKSKGGAHSFLMAYEAKAISDIQELLANARPQFSYSPEGSGPQLRRNVCASLLDVWKHILVNLDSTPHIHRDIYFRTLVTISLRSDFELSEDSLMAHNYLEAVAMSFSYISSKAAQLKSYPLLTEFAGDLIAVVYFRVPTLARRIDASCCFDPDTIPPAVQDVLKNFFPEAKGSRCVSRSFSDDDDNQSIRTAVSGSSPSLPLSQVVLPDEDGSINQLEKYMFWLEKLRVHDSFYFAFVKAWASLARSLYGTCAQSVGGTCALEWACVPGYRSITSTCLAVAGNIPPVRYPDPFRACLSQLLVNPEFVNPIMQLVLSRTNVYDAVGTTKVIMMLGEWLTVLQAMHGCLPKTFDFDIFCRAVDVLLASEHFQVLNATLSFLYTHLQMFRGERRRHLLVDILFRKYFLKLFLSCFDDVRIAFYHILLYQATANIEDPRHGVGHAAAQAASVSHARQRIEGKQDDCGTGSSPSRNRRRSLRRRSSSTAGGALLTPTLQPDESPLTNKEDASDSLQSSAEELDVVILAKIDAFLYLIDEQVETPDEDLGYFDESLKAYLQIALEEFRRVSLQRTRRLQQGLTEHPPLEFHEIVSIDLPATSLLLKDSDYDDQ